MNWRIKRLQERRAALVKSSDSILEAIAKDADRDPNESETKTLADNRSELDGIAAKITREEELAAFDVNSPIISGDGSIGSIKMAFEDDPNKGFKSPREFLTAVIMDSDRPAREASDERLRFLATAGSDEQGAYSDPYGGFLVPVGMSPDLLRLTPEEDPITPRTTKVPMTTPTLEIPARTDKDHTTSVSGGLVVTRRAETQAFASSVMQLEKVKLAAYSLFGLAYATEEILTDSPMSFAALLEAGFRDQFTYHLINERLNGTGVGEFQGIMNSPALVSVAKDTNQTATTITATNVIKMRSRCWRYSNAIWLANHDCLPQMIQLHLETSAGYPYSLYHQSLTADMTDTLLGRPVYYTEYTKTLGQKGDLVLANWSEYLEGTYQGLQSAESVHVRFLNHERTFKFWLRNAGTGWWRTPLTPKNSSSTLSPFVVCDIRA